MDDKDRLELMQIISRFEGYLFGAKVHDEFINTQLDRAMEILEQED